MLRRDAGTLGEQDHPSGITAFDATRFVRSSARASELSEAAKWARAAFDVKDVRADPEVGEAQQMIWSFLAYGSEMEVEVGKIRRFVGRLNLARSGCYPHRETSPPIGFTSTTGKARSLLVHPDEVAAVAALYELGIASHDYGHIASVLGEQTASRPGTRKPSARRFLAIGR